MLLGSRLPSYAAQTRSPATPAEATAHRMVSAAAAATGKPPLPRGRGAARPLTMMSWPLRVVRGETVTFFRFCGNPCVG